MCVVESSTIPFPELSVYSLLVFYDAPSASPLCMSSTALQPLCRQDLPVQSVSEACGALSESWMPSHHGLLWQAMVLRLQYANTITIMHLQVMPTSPCTVLDWP